jgi:hypothetical protein
VADFKNSRRLTYIALFMAFGLMILIVFKPSPEAAQVLMLGVPSIIALVNLQSHITNKAEKE